MSERCSEVVATYGETELGQTLRQMTRISAVMRARETLIEEEKVEVRIALCHLSRLWSSACSVQHLEQERIQDVPKETVRAVSGQHVDQGSARPV